jgi:hypothetical protein
VEEPVRTETLLSPVVEVPAGSLAPAPRPRPRPGLRVALVDNTKPNAGLILRLAGEMLSERLPGLQLDHHSKRTFGDAYHALDGLIGRYDLVLEALGD